MQSPDKIVGEIIAQRWQIVLFLGQGNMSYVYKAQDTQTGKVIILKLIKNTVLKNISDLESLIKQAKVFIALNHENIASYYDIHLCDTGLFLFCDYLSGESLTSLLSKAGKIPLERCVNLIAQISAALQYAHEKKILHGDLRPSNIYIVNDQFNTDEPKIVDFGFMHLIESMTQDNKLQVSSTHTLLGNAANMSPEQRLGQNIDQRSDLYSLGCLMYEIACGKPPFSSKSAMETTYKQKLQTPPELTQLLPEHPLLFRYQLIVNKLLRHNLKERYQSAFLVEQDLNLLAATKDIEWQKKANVLKKSQHSTLTVYKWRLALGIASLIFLTLMICAFAPILETYCAPWTDKFFDENKLWLVQDTFKENPSIQLLKQKDFLSNQLSVILQKQSKSSPVYIQTLFSLAQDLLACGQYNEALSKLNELKNIEITDKVIGPAELSTSLAFAQYAVGDLDRAQQSAKTGLNLSQNPNQIGNKFSALKVLGDIYNEQNDMVQAESMYQQMYSLAKGNRLKNAPEYAYAEALLADIWRRENRLKESEQLYTEAIDWGRNYVGPHGLFIAKACYGLALLYTQQRNWQAANFQLKQALPIAIARLGPKNSFVNSIKSLADYVLFHENIFAWCKVKMDDKR